MVESIEDESRSSVGSDVCRCVVSAAARSTWEDALFRPGRRTRGRRSVARDEKGSECMEGKRAAVRTERTMEGGMKQPFIKLSSGDGPHVA